MSKYFYRKTKSEINIIPLLDIALVLLLIFMGTMPITTCSLEVNLPNTSKSIESNINNNQSAIIEVFGIERYSLFLGENYLYKLTLDQLTNKVKHFIKLDPKTIFFISGAKNLPFDEIIKAINILKSAGVKSVGLITKTI